jgi:hypothetical protein
METQETPTNPPEGNITLSVRLPATLVTELRKAAAQMTLAGEKVTHNALVRRAIEQLLFNTPGGK